jgi:hypothetical protein
MNKSRSEALKIKIPSKTRGARGAVVVEALRYKPEGRGFDSRWCRWIFTLTNPSGRTMVLGSTQPLSEMSSRNIFWG